MGKQVSFILLPGDLKALEEELDRIRPFVVLHSRSHSEKVQRLGGLDPGKSGEDWLHLFLVRPEDVEFVVTQSVAAQGYWSIDALRSPVVEFQRCFYDGQRLRRGRAYFVEQYYDVNKQLVQKPETFRVWAQSVLSAIRRKLQRQGADYIGSEAKRWLSSGAGVLVD
jgi:hypothetical protein